MGILSKLLGGGEPASPAEAQRRALLQVLDDDLDAAEEGLREALQEESREIDPYFALGKIYRLRGELGRCIQLHQNLLLRSDLSAADRRQALLELARDFREAGFVQRAIAAFEELLVHEPRNVEALRSLVTLLEQAREYDRALAIQRRLARVAGRDRGEEARLYTAAARSAHAEGRADDARKCVGKALKSEPQHGEALFLRGALEAERGRDKKALEAWKQVAESSPAMGARVYPRLEATFASLDRAREFESLLRSILEKRPEDLEARMALARHLAARGDNDEAESALREVLGAQPGHRAARALLGRALLSDESTRERALDEYAELIGVLEKESQESS